MVIVFVENIVRNFTDSDPQKHLLTLATFNSWITSIIKDLCPSIHIMQAEKRLTNRIREHDHRSVLAEMVAYFAAKANSTPSLCREIHRHSQQLLFSSTSTLVNLFTPTRTTDSFKFLLGPNPVSDNVTV